jgi:hypothetical protein
MEHRLDSVDLHAQAWVAHFTTSDMFSASTSSAQIGKAATDCCRHLLSQDEIAENGGALEEHRGKVMNEKYFSSVVDGALKSAHLRPIALGAFLHKLVCVLNFLPHRLNCLRRAQIAKRQAVAAPYAKIDVLDPRESLLLPRAYKQVLEFSVALRDCRLTLHHPL